MFRRRYLVQTRFWPKNLDGHIVLGEASLYWLRSSAIRAANRRRFASDYAINNRAHVVIDQKTGEMIHQKH